MPATVANPRQSHDSEQISPPPVTHHTVYETTRNFQQIHVCQWGAHSYLVGPLSRLVGRSHFKPTLSKGVLRLIIAANGPNGAISLTQTFNSILFDVCNGRYVGLQKAKNGDREQKKIQTPFKWHPIGWRAGITQTTCSTDILGLEV